MRRVLGSLAGLTALLLSAIPVAAQTSAPEVEIVELNLGRYTEDGRVTMLVEFRNLADDVDPAQLEITEDGVPVENLTVQRIGREQVPVGIVLVIDTSGSMAGDPIEAAKAAAVAFVDQKRPEDFVAIVTFSDEVTVLSTFTNSATNLKSRIATIEASGGTAMFDGVVRASELFSASSEALRRNVIILTDGADENSTATVDSAIAALTTGNIRAFGVALESESFVPDDIERIATEANGLYLSTPEPEQLSDLYGQIQRELGNTLVVRFSASQNNPTGVTFGVSYGGGALTTSQASDVPGFVTTTTAGPTTTATFAAAQPVRIESDLPLDRGTLRWGAVAGLGVTAALFVFILLGGTSSDSEGRFAARLATYGRKSRDVEERRGLLERLPLLRRFSEAAEKEASKRGLLNAINATLEQGNIPLTAGEAFLAGIGLAALAGFVVGLVTLNPLVGLVVAAVIILFVFAVIKFVGGREKKKFESQLPDTLTLVSTSLRAGYSLLQAVEAVATEAPSPTSREFGRAIAEARLGRPVVDALEGIATRTQSTDFEWAVMAIEIQREVGGNLAEVLQTVAETMMQRNRLRGEIRALTAEGRISAIILGSLPFAMTLFMWFANPEYLRPLFEETLGLVAVGVGGLLILAGIVWLRKIINIEV